MTDFPRRRNFALNHISEIRIKEAMLEVEQLGASEALTEVITLLQLAVDRLADIIDKNYTVNED